MSKCQLSEMGTPGKMSPGNSCPLVSVLCLQLRDTVYCSWTVKRCVNIHDIGFMVYLADVVTTLKINLNNSDFHICEVSSCYSDNICPIGNLYSGLFG